MKPRNISLSRLRAPFVLSLTLGAVGAIACSNDNSGPTNQPPPIGGGDSSTGGKPGGAGGSANKDGGAGGATDAGGAPGTGGSDGGSPPPGSGGAPSAGGQGGAAGGDSGAPECDPSKTGSNPKGCYPCAPTKNDQFLNHCTSSDCSPFDNPGRLGADNWNGGKLKPLP